jgi:hypothetical protein
MKVPILGQATCEFLRYKRQVSKSGQIAFCGISRWRTA